MRSKYRILLATLLLILLLIKGLVAQTPLSSNGRLKLKGIQLTNESGYPIQLRGMSTHGLQWTWNCINNSSMDALAKDWGCDIIRAAMYIQESGYETNPTAFRAKVDQIVEMTELRGMYCLIDWHILTPGDPWYNVNAAKEFFDIMSKKHAGKKHMLYEICNEPNGNVSWASIKSYAEVIIPIIRKNDPEAIIIVGTPVWSSQFGDAANNPLTGANAYNVMYTLHTYTGTTYDFSYINYNLSRIPVFVTEWGVTDVTGQQGTDLNNSQKFIDMLAGKNSAGVKVSWCNWNYSDGGGQSNALAVGACGNAAWNNTSTSGTFIKKNILYPADDFKGTPAEPRAPFEGTAYAIPGKIEAENFDKGGEGVAYHDIEAANLGGQYRKTNGVDIEECTSGGYNIGFLEANEWLEYSVNVTKAGTYTIDFLTASNSTTEGSFKVFMDNVGLSESIKAPITGGWQTWGKTTQTVKLSVGQHTLRLSILAGGFNLDKMVFTQVIFVQEPYKTLNIPGTIEAENFDKGGEDLAYHDTEEANQGLAYRLDEGVDIEKCSEGGYNLGYMDPGEWLEYTVNVAATGSYQLDTRVASNMNGEFSISIDNVNATGVIKVDSTGGWQKWTSIRSQISLTKGTHIMRLNILKGAFNINYFKFIDIILSAKEIQKNISVDIFPNPTDGMVTIDLNNQNESDYTVYITDILGNKVFEEALHNSGNNRLNVNLSDKSPGVYLLNVKSASGVQLVKKLIKQ